MTTQSPAGADTALLPSLMSACLTYPKPHQSLPTDIHTCRNLSIRFHIGFQIRLQLELLSAACWMYLLPPVILDRYTALCLSWQRGIFPKIFLNFWEAFECECTEEHVEGGIVNSYSYVPVHPWSLMQSVLSEKEELHMHSPWGSAGEQWNIPHGAELGCALLCLHPALPSLCLMPSHTVRTAVLGDSKKKETWKCFDSPRIPQINFGFILNNSENC